MLTEKEFSEDKITD